MLDQRSPDHYARFELSDGASASLRLVKNKLRDDPAIILPVMAELLPILEFVVLLLYLSAIFIADLKLEWCISKLNCESLLR